MTRSHAVHREEKTVADPLATYLEDHIAGASYAIASSGRFATSVTGSRWLSSPLACLRK